MNIRDAILRAADTIQKHPAAFDFKQIRIPTDCGTPGCALGWIGHFAGIERCESGVTFKVPVLLGLSHSWGDMDFYSRMDSICEQFNQPPTVWQRDANACAATLRGYADKYHPAESRALIPASVTRIFQMSHAELAAELA